jgi:hypothetical protein
VTEAASAPAVDLAAYAIRVQEHVASTWADWFDGFEFAYGADDATMMTGLVADQAALHGLLNKVRDMNLTLLSVNRLELEAAPGGGHESVLKT